MIHDTSSQYMLVHHPHILFWHSRDINSSCSKPTADKWVMTALWEVTSTKKHLNIKVVWNRLIWVECVLEMYAERKETDKMHLKD